MSPDDPPRAALRVVVTDAIGRPLSRRSLARWLAGVAPARARGDVTVALVSDAEIRSLNRRFARVDRATDVLSFASDAFAAVSCPPSGPLPGPADRLQHLGDIVIATGVASRQARAAGHSVDIELRVLALHGLLHLLGYDHTADDGRMAKLERRLRRKGGLEAGLIDRTGQARGAGRAGRAGGALRLADDGKRARSGQAGRAAHTPVGQGFSLAGRRRRRR